MRIARTGASNSWASKLSTTTSADATSSSTPGSPGRPRTERTPWCRKRNSAEPVTGSTVVSAASPAVHERQGSPSGGSTLTTSAPASDEQLRAVRPAMPKLKSTTRRDSRPVSAGMAPSMASHRAAASGRRPDSGRHQEVRSRMGLRGDAAVVGIAEYAPERHFTGEAEVHARAVGRPGRARARRRRHRARPRSTGSSAANTSRESEMFVPSTIAEYCGWRGELRRARRPRRRQSAVGMVWRAAAAVELGICDVVVVRVGRATGPAAPPTPEPARSSLDASGRQSNLCGSPQAEFEIPYGNIGAERRLRDDRPAVRAPSSATTRGRSPRSPSTSGPTRSPTPMRSSTTSPSPSTTCSPAGWSPTRCTCWRS